MGTHVAERGAHDDGFVAMRLVVVEDPPDGQHTGVILARVGLASLRLVPVEDLTGIAVRQNVGAARALWELCLRGRRMER